MFEGGEFEVSESYRQVRDLSTTIDPNVTSIIHNEEHFCKLILYQEINNIKLVNTFHVFLFSFF